MQYNQNNLCNRFPLTSCSDGVVISRVKLSNSLYRIAAWGTCYEIAFFECHNTWLVYVGSGNGLVSPGNKLLPEPMLFTWTNVDPDLISGIP